MSFLRTSRVRSLFLKGFLLFVCAFFNTSLVHSAEVPSEFQNLYQALRRDLDTFQNAMVSQWDGAKDVPHFAAELLTANCNLGEKLLSGTQLTAVDIELAALASLGVDTVTIALGFPVLHQPFYDWLKTQPGFMAIPYGASDFLSFYQAVFAKVRALGMRLALEVHVVFSTGTGNPWPLFQYYQTLTFPQYVDGRSAALVTVARQLRPDYLQLQAEPETEVILTGFTEIGEVATCTTMVARFLADLDAADTWIPFGLHTSVLTSAGVGTWNLPSFEQLVLNEAQMPGLDIIDMHLYPINQTATHDFLANAVWIADHANGKKISMTEAWLDKRGDSELGSDPFDILARNNYSFWSPLDQEFLQTMVKFGHWKNLEFVSPFWSTYFYGYMDYAEAQKACPPGPNQTACLNDQGMLAASANLTQGKYSPTGLAYKQFILGNFLPDITSPAACTPNPVTAKTATLSVNATDDRGPANLTYHWEETGNPGLTSQLATPAQPSTRVTFPMAGRYSFAVTVVDAGGNSVGSSVTVLVNPSMRAMLNLLLE